MTAGQLAMDGGLAASRRSAKHIRLAAGDIVLGR